MKPNDYRDFESKLYDELLRVGINNNIAQTIVSSNGKSDSEVIFKFLHENNRYIKKS